MYQVLVVTFFFKHDIHIAGFDEHLHPGRDVLHLQLDLAASFPQLPQVRDHADDYSAAGSSADRSYPPAAAHPPLSGTPLTS